jgi:glycosyltransferase involved in cell wall biosynthesis
VSNQTKQEWADFGYSPELIEVVHNGTDFTKFKPAEDFSDLRQDWQVPENRRLISYIGRIDSMKGLESLIQAIAILTRNGENVELALAGKPVVHYSFIKKTECEEEGQKYQRSLSDLATELGVSDRIQFLGHLADPVPLYQASDVSVLASTWNEPFGRSIIESMACGTPVVASRVGGIPEILTGEFDRQLVNPGDPEDLAAHLAQVMHWRQDDPSLGARCRQQVLNRFTYEKMIDGIERVLQSVPSPEQSAARTA